MNEEKFLDNGFNYKEDKSFGSPIDVFMNIMMKYQRF